MRYEELVAGVEYLVGGVSGTVRFREDGIVERKWPRSLDWSESNLNYNFLLRAEYEPVPWEPEIGNIYYVPSPVYPVGYESFRWYDRKEDLHRKETLGVFKTQEEAQEEAKRRGWL